MSFGVTGQNRASANRESLIEPAVVFEDRNTPGQRRVEWIGDDGRGELQIFTGPTARRDALRYAVQN